MEIRTNSFDPNRSNLARTDITRPSRETIEDRVVLPGEESEDGQSPRALNARHEALAKRVQNARAEALEQRVANARADHLEQRVANARAEALEQRIANARAEAQAPRVAGAAADASGAAEETGSTGGSLAQRIANARQEALAKRVSNARQEQLADRIASARAGDDVQISDVSRMLASPAAADALSRDEGEGRARRIDELRRAYESGQLNSAELIARTAWRMLSGE